MSSESTSEETTSTSESADSSSDAPDGQSEHESSAATADERRDSRYRARLREAEAERDRLREALVPHVRAAVERAVSDRLQDATALWLLPDADPMSMLDDDMGVDEERVAAAVDKLLAHAPALARRAGSADAGARTPQSGPSSKWAGLLNPQH